MKQNDIWLINLDPTVGAEIRKIIPNEQNGLIKKSSADCFQVRSVSQNRFVKKIGALSDLTMSEIKLGLSKVLSIEN